MNEKKHWNRIAPTYNAEIFDVFESDAKKKLAGYFKKHGNKNHDAIDFGCGNGKAFTYLSPSFKTVLGLDISLKLLDQPKLLHYKTIKLEQEDLTTQLRDPKANLIFCCNVAILPEVGATITIT